MATPRERNLLQIWGVYVEGIGDVAVQQQRSGGVLGFVDTVWWYNVDGFQNPANHHPDDEKIPLFIGFLHHSRWLFGISSINRRSGVESGYTRYPETGYTRYPETNIQVRPWKWIDPLEEKEFPDLESTIFLGDVLVLQSVCHWR